TAAQFLGGTSVIEPVYIGGGASVCWSGSQICGQWPPSTPWGTMHDAYAVLVKGSKQPSMTIERVLAFDHGDGISFDAQPDGQWSVRGVHVRYSRDDCLENDFLNAGTIADSFFDGCYSSFSAQSYTSVQDGSNKLVTLKSSLVRTQAMDQPYSGTSPNANPFFKWD